MKPQTATSKIGHEIPAATSTDPLWTVEDVAKYLRLREETIRMMARSRKIPALKVGKSWRFRINDVKEMLAKQ